MIGTGYAVDASLPARIKAQQSAQKILTFAADGAQICDVEEKKDISVAVIYAGEKLYYEINDNKYEHIYELDEPERVMFYCEKSGASANIADIFANKYEKEIEK